MQRIEIRNFRQIVQANVQVNDLTIIIGEQASGKSTIAKLVYFFKSLRKDLVEMSRMNPGEINGLKISNQIRDKFFLYFGSSARLAENYEVKFYFDDDNRVVINGSRPVKVNFEPQYFFNEIENEIRRASNSVNFYRQREDFNTAEREEQLLESSLSEMFSDNRIAVYIPAGRNITVSYTDEFLELFRELVKVKTTLLIGSDGLPKRQDSEEIDLILLRDFIYHSSLLRKKYIGLGMNGMLRQVENTFVRGALRDSISKLLKATYAHSERAGEYLRTTNGETIALRKASSGQQESIRIIQDAVLQIADLSPAFRVLEEPEAHLFPSGQHRMLEILAALVNTSSEHHIGGNNQLFITTHSPYLLSILNNQLFAGELEIEGNGYSNRAINEAGIPQPFRLKPRQVSAYMLGIDGICVPINDTAQGDFSDSATGLIGDNLLENYWNVLQSQFDDLMEIEP